MAVHSLHKPIGEFGAGTNCTHTKDSTEYSPLVCVCRSAAASFWPKHLLLTECMLTLQYTVDNLRKCVLFDEHVGVVMFVVKGWTACVTTFRHD